MDRAIGHQHKPQRTRWTDALDKVFTDLVVEQIRLGNRPNNVFDKKVWSHIRDTFNKQTNLNFNNNQLRKHLDVLRTRYLTVKSAFGQSDFIMDDSCCIEFDDLWDGDILEQEQPKIEPAKVKECPIFDQLSTIFAETFVDGQYAQSSHYEELDKSLHVKYPENEIPHVKTPSSSTFATSNALPERKRKHSLDIGSAPEQTKNNSQEINETMAKALFDMLDAYKLRKGLKSEQKDKFTITKCVKVLDDIESEEGMDGNLYFAALDLFENPSLRETFLSMKCNKMRLAWLHCKCSRSIATSSSG